jgi:hypothetical protein
MTAAEALLTERIEDLDDESPGTVGKTVVELLLAAGAALQERQDYGAEGFITATAHVDTAISLLTHYRERLEFLADIESKAALEEMLQAQASAGEAGAPDGVTP